MMDVMQNKVLLVDDDPGVRSSICRPLKGAATCALKLKMDGPLWTVVDSESPDLVVLDMLLSDAQMSESDACKEIRQKGILIPVILPTIKDRMMNPRYMEQAFRSGGARISGIGRLSGVPRSVLLVGMAYS